MSNNPTISYIHLNVDGAISGAQGLTGVEISFGYYKTYLSSLESKLGTLSSYTKKLNGVSSAIDTTSLSKFLILGRSLADEANDCMKDVARKIREALTIEHKNLTEAQKMGLILLDGYGTFGYR